MKKNFSTRIEELRGHKTQKEFAKFIGVPLNTYTNWARQIRQPNLEAIVSICTQLSVSADWLLGLGDAEAPAERAVQVAETKLYEKTAPPPSPPDACDWRALAISQQQTIAQLTRLLAEATEKKDRVKTPRASTGGANVHAG